MNSAAARTAMPWGEHLSEARRRAVRAAAALLASVVIGYVLSDAVMTLLREPIVQIAESRQATLNYDTVTGAFNLRMRIALFAGVFIASPVLMYELFAFLAPGLQRRERRYILGFVATAVPLFLVGGVVGLRLFPNMVELLVGFASSEDSTILQASEYFDFAMRVALMSAIAFVLPVLLVMLNLIGVLSGAAIARAWRPILIGILVFSALATPSADVLSMVLIAGCLCILTAAATVIGVLHDRALERRMAIAPDPDPADIRISEFG
ncbi:MAG: twin-arginine translocase subunit TatC [Cumulibacter sp.]